jgi:hypothetical protein
MAWVMTAAMLFTGKDNGVAWLYNDKTAEVEAANLRTAENPYDDNIVTMEQIVDEDVTREQGMKTRLNAKEKEIEGDKTLMQEMKEREAALQEELRQAKSDLARERATGKDLARERAILQEKAGFLDTHKNGKTAAVAAVITRYATAGTPSKFRDSLMLLLESIRDVNTRSEWNLVPVALCMKGDDNVPENAIAELQHLGFTVKMEDAVVEMKDISSDAAELYVKEIHKE